LRVISGIAKGRRLKDVPGDSTRPITDRVKEALFNILAGELLDSTWWDLFSGTGSVGIEAISRGAKSVRFVDLERKAINTIQQNIDLVGFSDKVEIKQGDAFSYLQMNPDSSFDFLFIAPPQYREMWLKTLKILDANINWIHENSIVIVQIHPKEYSEIKLDNLVEYDQRKYGSTLLIFYEKLIN
jgi:16S rRNA (guanine966-N2)-methyltransferase